MTEHIYTKVFLEVEISDIMNHFAGNEWSKKKEILSLKAEFQGVFSFPIGRIGEKIINSNYC